MPKAGLKVLFLQTASDVREKLRAIPGAIRFDPEHAGGGSGREPRNVTPLHQPDMLTSEKSEATVSPSDLDDPRESENSEEFIDYVTSKPADIELLPTADSAVVGRGTCASHRASRAGRGPVLVWSETALEGVTA